jgi:hypothetical protein
MTLPKLLRRSGPIALGVALVGALVLSRPTPVEAAEAGPICLAGLVRQCSEIVLCNQVSQMGECTDQWTFYFYWDYI